LLNSQTTRKEAQNQRFLERSWKVCRRIVNAHFIVEERYLQDHPDLILHRHQHYSFINHLKQFERNYLSSDNTLGIDVVIFMTDWLRGHFLSTDKQQFHYLTTAGDIS